MADTATTCTHECACDPLKRIIRLFTRKGISVGEEAGNEELISKLHLVYKSPLLRFPLARGGGRAGKQLECRLAEDTIKSLREILMEENLTQDNVSFDLDKTRDLKDPRVKQVEVDERLGNATLQLDIGIMTGEVIKWAVVEGWSGYSKNACHNQLFQIEIAMTRPKSTSLEDSSDSSFLEYRKLLVAQAVTKLLKKIGHSVDDGHFSCLPHRVSSDTNEVKIQANTILIAGTAISVDDRENLCGTSPDAVLRVDLGNVIADPPIVQDMLSKRLAEIKEISESRCSESLLLSSWASSLDNLVRITLHYDLLYRPLEADIEVVSLYNSGQMNNNALFIMYNYSRVLSILRKFSKQVENGEYPELMTLSEVDFTGICEREEELLILQLLMEWPRIMESAVNFLRFQLNLVIITKYLLALSKAFNSFYFQIVVLVPTNASHNFPKMMARIYLIKAICKVFEDCLEILQVSHANSESPK